MHSAHPVANPFALLLNPEATAEVRSYVDLVVLNKAESDSGVEPDF